MNKDDIQKKIDFIEIDIKALKGKLNLISIEKPICRKCKRVELVEWGDTYKCKHCDTFTQLPKYKRVPRD